MGVRGVILDIDGTIRHGDQQIPGASAAIDFLRDRDISLVFVSNNPVYSPERYADRLQQLGIEASAEEIVTSGTITAEFLAENHPRDQIFVIGEVGLFDQLNAVDLSISMSPTDANVLVVSIDRNFRYETLVDAMQVVQNDSVPFYGTDPDVTIPATRGRIPGSGALIAAVSELVGRDADLIFGKPSDIAIDVITNKLNGSLNECLIVGDRLDTDIALGNRASIGSILVESGISSTSSIERSQWKPDSVIRDITALPTLLDAWSV